MNKVPLAVFIVLAILLLSGCYGSAINQTNQSLSVYYNKDALPPAISSVISEYKGEHPNVNFKVYDPTDGDTSMTEENAIKKMDSDIMVGKGPDLILAQASDMDVYKMARAGTFYDIDQFLSKDSTFDISAYNKVVFNAGIISKKRYIIPLEYEIPILLTTKEKMEKSGFKISTMNADDFDNEALRVLKQDDAVSLYNQNGYGGLWYFQFPDAFDFEKERAEFDTPQFQKAMEECKEEYQKEKRYPELIIKTYPSPEYTEYLERYVQNDILFDEASSIGVQIQEGPFFETFGQADLFPVYNDEGGLTAEVDIFAAIIAKSPNRKNAYDFLKLVLSPSLMSFLSNPTLDSAVGSQLKIFKDMIDKEVDTSKSLTDNGYPEAKLPESFYQECASYPAKVNRVILNMTPYDELLEQFRPYFEGKETYEKCLKDAKNYFDLYMSE